MTTWQRRLMDLLSMFPWSDGIVENISGLPEKGRFAVISSRKDDPNDHWIDGIADSEHGVACIIMGLLLEDEWILVGVFSLDGEPGDPIESVPTSVSACYRIGDVLQHELVAQLGERRFPLNVHPTGWAEGLFEGAWA